MSGGYTFRNFSGYSDFENPISQYVYLDTTVTANFYSNPPPQYKLTVSSGTGGSTSLSSGDHYYTPQVVTVTAYPDDDYVFDYWLLDSTGHGENPITVPMSSDHTLQANFRLANPHWVTVYAYNEYSCPGYSVPVYVNSQLAGCTDSNGEFSVSLPEGNYYIGVDSYLEDLGYFEYPGGDHFLQYLRIGSYYEYASDIYVSLTSDTTIDAYYSSTGFQP